MGQHIIGGAPVNLSASGAVSLVPGTLIGIMVNSTTGGTIVIVNGTTSGGTAVTGTITPAIGFLPCYMTLNTGCFLTLANTINVTAVFQPG